MNTNCNRNTNTNRTINRNTNTNRNTTNTNTNRNATNTNTNRNATNTNTNRNATNTNANANRTTTNTNANRTTTNTNANRTTTNANANRNTTNANATNTNREQARVSGQHQVDPSVLRKTDDGSQINAWRQGGTGNCSSCATIKAATDAYGKAGVFDKISERSDGGYDLRLQNGRDVSLTKNELALAKSKSRFIELGKGDDLKFAHLAYGAMAKNKQNLLGYRSYSQALNSLNDGENPVSATKWLGIPENQVNRLRGSDLAKHDSVVAWNSRHAVFVDRPDDANGWDKQKYDAYGKARDYGAGSGGEVRYRRGLFGRSIPYRTSGGSTYNNGFALGPRPNANANGGGTTPRVNGGGTTPRVNGGGTTPPVNGGGTAPVNGGGTTPRVNGGGTAPVNGGGTAPVDGVRNTERTDVGRVSYGHHQYAEALAKAKELGRPVVMKLGASWCGPCRAMKTGAMKDPAVQRMLQNNAVFLDVEADVRNDPNPKVAKDILSSLNVRSYPTNIIARVVQGENGLEPQIITQKAGGMSAAQYQNWLKANLPNLAQ